jgi:predicted transcriptional regulator of viral defense system
LEGYKMRLEYVISKKTLGPKSARLVSTLREQGRSLFTLADIEEITGDSRSPRQFAASLVKRGVATRLKPGLFNLVPFEMGDDGTYLGDPLLVVPKLAKGQEYFISHGSAMELHQMATQPILTVYVTSPVPRRNTTILGTDFRFIGCKPEHFFGGMKMWFPGRQTLTVSDRERTVIDGLRHPRYCGGMTEVAKGLWLARGKLNTMKMVAYASSLGIGAVSRRLGFLMELYGIGGTQELGLLRRHAAPRTYVKLDPNLPDKGANSTDWGLRLNTTPDELLAARTT